MKIWDGGEQRWTRVAFSTQTEAWVLRRQDRLFIELIDGRESFLPANGWEFRSSSLIN